MRLAFLNADYPSFLASLYQQPGLSSASYAQQMQARNDSLFSTADHYSAAFAALGHPAIDIHINNESMQRAWAIEHGMEEASVSSPSTPTGRPIDVARSAFSLPGLRRLRPFARASLRRVRRPWLVDVLDAQLADHAPNVVVDQAVGAVEIGDIRRMAPHALLVAHVATTVEWELVRQYDLLVSSLPGMVEHATRNGMAALLSRFAFHPRVLAAIKPPAESCDVTFSGSLAAAHGRRRNLLQAVAGAVPIDVFTDGVLPHASANARLHAPVFGRDMYSVLRASRATLNEHGDVIFGGRNMTASSANNIRLFEATGVGTALVTDHKADLAEMFVPGEELVTFVDADDCITVLRELLQDEDRRSSIAAAGQRRTLRDHTYDQRVGELVCGLAAQVGG